MMLNGMLPGLVAIKAPCAFVSVGGAAMLNRRMSLPVSILRRWESKVIQE
jgi:ammonia channel protein AmtB